MLQQVLKKCLCMLQVLKVLQECLYAPGSQGSPGMSVYATGSQGSPRMSVYSTSSQGIYV